MVVLKSPARSRLLSHYNFQSICPNKQWGLYFRRERAKGGRGGHPLGAGEEEAEDLAVVSRAVDELDRRHVQFCKATRRDTRHELACQECAIVMIDTVTLHCHSLPLLRESHSNLAVIFCQKWRCRPGLECDARRDGGGGRLGPGTACQCRRS